MLVSLCLAAAHSPGLNAGEEQPPRSGLAETRPVVSWKIRARSSRSAPARCCGIWSRRVERPNPRTPPRRPGAASFRLRTSLASKFFVSRAHQRHSPGRGRGAGQEPDRGGFVPKADRHLGQMVFRSAPRPVLSSLRSVWRSAAGSADEGYDGKAFYEAPSSANWSGATTNSGRRATASGRKSYVSRLLTDAYQNHQRHPAAQSQPGPGLRQSLRPLIGSVDNTIRFEAVSDPVAQLAQAIPEIYALPEIGDEVVLNIVDALICQYQGEERTLLHYSNHAPPIALQHRSRRSRHPVRPRAGRQRQLARIPPVKISWQIYTNASLLELGVSDPRLIDIVKVGAATP